jgi:hypothetical protein
VSLSVIALRCSHAGPLKYVGAATAPHVVFLTALIIRSVWEAGTGNGERPKRAL